MYRIGDLVYYENAGVCRITDITMRDLTGQTLQYYILAPLYASYEISTPVERPKMFMRPILSKREAEQLIDRIPDMHAEAFHSKVLRELSEHYEAALRQHDCAALIVLTMSLYAKRRDTEQSNRKFGAVDERFMKRAEDLLFGELAASLAIPRDNVPDYIAARVAQPS